MVVLSGQNYIYINIYIYILHRALLFLDSPSSSVQGIVTEEGHFDGHISTPTEHFYIEPAKR